MTEQPTTTTAVVTDDDAAAINAARDALNRIKDRAYMAGYDAPKISDDWREARPQNWGQLCEAADIAQNLLFNVLNVARSYCNAPLTDEQIHNRHDDETEA